MSLHFFPNFLRFSRDFTRFSNLNTLLKMYFCAGVPRSFDSLTEIPLVREKDPRKKRVLTIGPFGRRSAPVRPNSGETLPGSAGERRVGDQGLTYDARGP
jgi:hypothetical protein